MKYHLKMNFVKNQGKYPKTWMYNQIRLVGNIGIFVEMT